MRKSFTTALGLGILAGSMTLTPAMAQVRGQSAVGYYDQSSRTYVQVNSYSDRSYDRYHDDYRDRYSHRDDYYDRSDDYSYRSGDVYYEGYYGDRDRRRGEVYYPQRDNSGEVIAGVLVGAVIGYALAESNDHDRYRGRHHRYRYSHHNRRHRDYGRHRRYGW